VGGKQTSHKLPFIRSCWTGEAGVFGGDCGGVSFVATEAHATWSTSLGLRLKQGFRQPFYVQRHSRAG
jgi:hypothetical protein